MEKIPKLTDGTLAERFEKLRMKINEIVEFLGLLPIDPPSDDTDEQELYGD